MKLKFTVITAILALLLTVGVRAEGAESPDLLEEFGKASLEEFSDIVPAAAAGLGGDADAIAEGFTVGHVVDMIVAELAELVSPLTRQLAILIGVVIVISAVNAAKNSISNGSLTTALEYVTLLCAVLAAYGTISSVWQRIADTLTNLTAFMTGLIPMMGTLYAAGGNVTNAAVSTAGLLTLTDFSSSFHIICCCRCCEFASGYRL